MPTPIQRNGRPTPVHALLRDRPEVVIVFARKHVQHIPVAARGAPDSQQRRSRGRSGKKSRAAPQHPFLCDVFARTGVCPRGGACPDVHADAAKAKTLVPHIRNDVDGQPLGLQNDGTPAPRFEARLGTLSVARPNGERAELSIAATSCLQTRVLDTDRRPVSVCAHFVQTGMCDFGAACQFLHPLVAPSRTSRGQQPSAARNRPAHAHPGDIPLPQALSRGALLTEAELARSGRHGHDDDAAAAGDVKKVNAFVAMMAVSPMTSSSADGSSFDNVLEDGPHGEYAFTAEDISDLMAEVVHPAAAQHPAPAARGATPRRNLPLPPLGGPPATAGAAEYDIRSAESVPCSDGERNSGVLRRTGSAAAAGAGGASSRCPSRPGAATLDRGPGSSATLLSGGPRFGSSGSLTHARYCHDPYGAKGWAGVPTASGSTASDPSDLGDAIEYHHHTAAPSDAARLQQHQHHHQQRHT
eukprot:CAMPEP_0174834226 /NCGR_PEP_ID=MMETSP1114-20130205/4700_1 /TAXON_ID=312471 /ORGANISM="Neobodo designis, Strain CCAP 1951/1" /LENGTH=470 /DNA_ID=CAMNT_0016068133 /DNA_START=116 /DNA_END=1528 /DNA_ORIENTATION=+